MEKQVVIIFGAPGAGKGTQAELLSDKFGLYNFETSGIIGKKMAEAKAGDFVEVDGEKYFTVNKSAPFDKRFHLLLNVAVGGDWPGNPNEFTTFPQTMVVDYVRVYQRP